MDIKYHIEKAFDFFLDNIVSLILITLALIALSAVTLGILAPVAIAGYMHSLLLLVRDGREPKAQDVLSRLNLFFPLLLFCIAVLVITVIGLALVVLPGIIFLLAISYLCLYMIPLMTDRELGLFEAVKTSVHITTKDRVVDHIVIFIIFTAVSTLGSSFFIGTLITQPLATLFLMSVYHHELTTVKVPGQWKK